MTLTNKKYSIDIFFALINVKKATGSPSDAMPERSEPEGLGLAGERAVVKYKNQARKS